MRNRQKLGEIVVKTFGHNPRPIMLPVEFGAIELALYTMHREWPEQAATAFAVAIRPRRTAFAFPWLKDRELAGANLRFYTEVFSKGRLRRHLSDYLQIQSRIFDLGSEGEPVIRDEALLQTRASVYDALLSEVPPYDEISFATSDDIDQAIGDEADLIVHVREQRIALDNADTNPDGVAWRARVPRSAWKADECPPIKVGPRRNRSLCLDSLAEFASSFEKDVLARVEFILPDGTRSRSAPLGQIGHIPAMVNVGKSTLARALARQEAAQGGRTLFLVANTAEGFQLARRLGTINDFKTVVLIGRSDEQRHLENRERADRIDDDFSVYLEDDWRTIGRGCPLEAMAVVEAGREDLPDRQHFRPCDYLWLELPSKTGKPRFRQTKCGFAERCPSVERYRRLRDADAVICTVQSFVHSRVPGWIDRRGLRISEFAYEFCSLVIADEADALQRQFEEAFYSHWTLTGRADAIGPKTTGLVTRHLSDGHRDRRPGVADFIDYSGRLAVSTDRLIETCRRGGLNRLFDRFLFPQDFAMRAFDLIDPLPKASASKLAEDPGLSAAVTDRQAMRQAFLMEVSRCGSRWFSRKHVEDTSELWSDDASFSFSEEVHKAIDACYQAVVSGSEVEEETVTLLNSLVQEIGDRANFIPDSDVRGLEATKDARYEAWRLLQAAFHADYLTRIATFFTAGRSPLHQEAIGSGEFNLPAPMYRTYAPMVTSGPIYGLRIVEDEMSLRAKMNARERISPGIAVELTAVDFIGRAVLTQFHDFYAPHLGAGPACLLLSGTSVNPASSEYHVPCSLTALMVNRSVEKGTVAKSRGHYLPLFYPLDRLGKRLPIAFSGQPLANRKEIVRAAAEAFQRDGAWRHILETCPPGRERALIYFHRVEDAAIFVKHLVDIGLLSAGEAAYVRGSTVNPGDEFEPFAVSRSELEDPLTLAPLKVLAAARGSVNRGLNMMIGDASAFGALVFMPAPHPVPADMGLAIAWATAGSLVCYNRTLSNISEPINKIERDGVRLRRGFLDRSLPYRRRRAKSEFRADEVAGQAAELNQAIGRGLRGNKSIEVFFVDPEFVPLLAEIDAVFDKDQSGDLSHEAFKLTFSPTRTVIRTFLKDAESQDETIRRYGVQR